MTASDPPRLDYRAAWNHAVGLYVAQLAESTRLRDALEDIAALADDEWDRPHRYQLEIAAAAREALGDED